MWISKKFNRLTKVWQSESTWISLMPSDFAWASAAQVAQASASSAELTWVCVIKPLTSLIVISSVLRWKDQPKHAISVAASHTASEETEIDMGGGCNPGNKVDGRAGTEAGFEIGYLRVGCGDSLAYQRVWASCQHFASIFSFKTISTPENEEGEKIKAFRAFHKNQQI